MTLHLDWPAIQDQAVNLLQKLIRFDTSNPPGNELSAAEFIADELRAVGYEPRVFVPAPERGNVIARLEGDGSERPLFLFGHLDVVPAEPDQWTYPPFEGVIADGFVWGRGALDMKYIVAAQLATVLALKEAGARLKRDVIYAATADEEIGGKWGMEWLLENHPDLLDAEYALTELGGFSMDVDGHRFYTCQTGEKGVARFQMRTTGRPGHGSMPHSDSAIVYLSEAIAKLGRTPTPLHISPTAQTMIEEMARVQPMLKGLLSPETCPGVLAQLPREQALLFNAIVRNTISITIVNAGYKRNVIPGSAEATLDCRLIPGQTADDVIREIHDIVGPEAGIELEVTMHMAATESRFDTSLFETIVRNVKRYDPEATVVPMLSTVGTDGRFLGARGVNYYGFGPLRIPQGFGFTELLHSHDERIPIDAFREGVQVLGETVLDFCSGSA